MTRTLVVTPLRAGSDDGAAQALRVGWSADLARMIVGNDGTLRVVDGPEAPDPAPSRSTFRITGDARSDAGILHATIRLSHEREGPIDWSRTFSRPIAEIEPLREEMASKLADVTVCALGRTNPEALAFDESELRLLFGACDQKQLPDYPEAAKLLRQLLALRPRFAHGWALLAFVEQLSARFGLGESTSLRADAERSAQRALALDPNDADAYYARALGIDGLKHWSERMEFLERGHALDPMNGRIDNAIGIALEHVGRWQEAATFHALAVKADPFSTAKTSALVYVLGWGGDVEGAMAALVDARRRFGKHRVVAYVDFTFNALLGDAQRARAILDDPARGFVLAPENAVLWSSLIAARIAPSAENEQRADRAVDVATRSADPDATVVIDWLARHDRVDEAFAFIDRLQRDRPEDLDTVILFTVVARALRDDPRFMTVAARSGLIAIWTRTGRWPDFCSDHALTYDCRTEAQRAVSSEPRPLAARR